MKSLRVKVGRKFLSTISKRIFTVTNITKRDGKALAHVSVNDGSSGVWLCDNGMMPSWFTLPNCKV